MAVTASERHVDVGDVDGTPFMGIASFGFDSDANRIANEAKLIKGNLVYLYAALRALVGWKPASFTRRPSTASATRCAGYSVAVAQLRRPTAAACSSLPHAELDDGMLDVVISERHPKLRFLRDLPKVFKGTHLDNPPTRTCFRGEEVEVERGPAVRHLRRRRPDRRHCPPR